MTGHGKTQKTDDMICLGRFSDPHGLRGQIHLTYFGENPDFIKNAGLYQSDGSPLFIKICRRDKMNLVVSVEGIDDRTAAEGLKGQEIYVRRRDLPSVGEGEYYRSDLMGMTVRNKTGKVLGVVHSVEDYGAGTVIEVKLDQPIKGIGRLALIPFRDELVPEVNLKKHSLVVDWDDWFANQVETSRGEENK